MEIDTDNSRRGQYAPKKRKLTKCNDFADEQSDRKLLEGINPYDCITGQPAHRGDVQQICHEGFEKEMRKIQKALNLTEEQVQETKNAQHGA